MIDIRYTRGLDELALHEWARHPKLSLYLPCSGEEEMRIFSRTWMYFSSKKAGLTAVVHNRCVGMGVLILMPYEKVMHHALVQMMVHPDHMRSGIGGELLKNLKHLAKTYFHIEVLFLELIGPTPHLKFFEMWGFKVYATQNGYVEGPLPDKILLECVL